MAANFANLATQVVQPDGSVLDLWASGDEFANRLHDAEGYTIIQSQADGYYYYAVLRSGEPAPSQFRAGSSDPRALGLQPGLNISPAKYRENVQFMRSHERSGERGPNTGTVNNIVVYIRFADQTEFPDPRSVYDAKFNAVGEGEYSLRNYFHQVSYDQLNYVSHHFPTCAMDLNLSYQDTHPRAYYMPYNATTNPQGYRDWQRTDREHALLASAIDAIAPQVPASLNIDADNDDYVDNVCFIIRGPHTAWNNLLWAHRWALYTVDSFINGKMVWDFTFQPENQNSVRTLCHEMFHSVGAPDLYHYEFDGLTPAGCWDIMESGNAHMGMHMKARYGEWIAPIPTILAGTYTLNPVTSPVNNAYRIPLSGSDYLVLEYRKQDSDVFEAELPGSGLLIYRVNENESGNSEGPPDEVYIFRPDGSSSQNGAIAEAAFSAQNHQTEFNQYTNPSCFLTNGTPFPVNIHSVSTAGDNISFTLSTSTDAYPPTISDLVPADGANLTLADMQVGANISAPSGNISSVEFWLDGQLHASTPAGPYAWTVPANQLTAGAHEIEIKATTSEQLTATEISSVRIVDPQQETWFSWLSAEPAWSDFGRGAIPIKAALDLDLGTQEYVVKKIAFSLVPDPWGFPAVPGLVNARINRFANGAITEQTVLTIGDIMCPMDGRFEYTVNSLTPLSGQIAVILDLFEYQKIVFDTNASCGHSWLTEPSRPWTDALGRGMQGAAAIELLLQAPNVGLEEGLNPSQVQSLSAAPNPFTAQTAISFDLKTSARVDLDIYNLRGQKVRELCSADLAKGGHSLVWNGLDGNQRAVGTGIYLYRLRSGSQVLTGKVALVR